MTIIRPGDKKLHSWLVFSPYHYHRDSCYEPPEYGCDAVEVKAYTKREAIVLGVKQMFKEKMDWVINNRADGSPPFKGIKAEIMACHHGTEDSECPACEYEYAAQERSGFIYQ
jgi:hypothetical protein